MLIVLSGLGRTPLWPHDAVFDPGPIGVTNALLALANEAIAEGWDESVVVVQDDVQPVPIGKHWGDITSYWGSFTGRWGWKIVDHICPKAFSATQNGWRQARDAWSRPGRNCELWRPDYVYDPEKRGWREWRQR